MVELADPELEQKRRDKLQQARAQSHWQEIWMAYNDHADKAATRARRRHPVPVEEVARVKRIDCLARRALLAAVEAVQAAGDARRAFG